MTKKHLPPRPSLRLSACSVLLFLAVTGHAQELRTRQILMNLSLNHSIDGYEVSCNRKTILAWGKAQLISKSNPQDSEITIVDARKRKIIVATGLTGGIYGAKFVRKENLAVMESAIDVVVNLTTGANHQLNPNTEASSLYQFETCDDFPGKSFLKYQN